MSELEPILDRNSGPERLVATRDPRVIAEMFNRISSRYDLMNRIMTFGQDGRWRRLAADKTGLRPGGRALDVATGTGDMARELYSRVGPTGEVVGVDIADSMLAVARSKTLHLPIRFEQADVCDLTFDEEFDAATVTFGLRNFPDREAGIRSTARALRPGGRLVILELIPTAGTLAPVLSWYEQRLIPLVGALVTRQGLAYRYLPASVSASLTRLQIKGLMKSCGLQDIASRDLTFGTVAIVWGRKPAERAPSAGVGIDSG